MAQTQLDKAEAALVALGHDTSTARVAAFAVLEAIRVPSIAMVMAAGEQPSRVVRIYMAMIDAVARGD